MNWPLLAKKALLAAASVTLAWPAVGFAGTVPVVTDTKWKVFDANGQWLGFAQTVCLNSSSPSNCPRTDVPPPTEYGYPHPGWTADVSSLPPTVRWIWAPDVTGASSPAALQTFTFETQFLLCDPPTGGTISIAADNAAEVSLNGMPVPSSASSSPNALRTVSVPASSLFGSSLLGGIRLNTLKITASNAANPADCGSDQYQCNPAGVLLGASFEFAGNPTCNGYRSNKVYMNGEEETLGPCPAGQTGTKFHTCWCGVWVDGDRCVTPPPTCTGNDGMTYRVDERETVSCPAATPVGSASRQCLAKDTWGSPDNSRCMPAPRTCTGNGGVVFIVGQTEDVGACTGRRVGTRSRTCKPDGTWTAVVDTCRLPDVCVGAPPGTCICGSRELGLTGNCPMGVQCGPHLIGDPDHPGLTPTLRTADWYCGDLPLVALGESCSYNGNCVSGWCDSGWGTSNTKKCMPRAGTGNLNDWCSNNNQCASGRCGGLRQDVSGRWYPGRCTNTTSALGEFCSVNSDCASTYCDRGDGTSKTSMCMPRGGAGRSGDWCSHDNQCASRVCGGLQPRPDGSWQPGHCN